MNGFMEGLAEGFTTSYAQSFDAAEKRKLFMEETEKQKRKSLQAVLPRVQEELLARENMSQTLDYLEGRGVNAQTMAVLASDPTALEEANKLLTRTEAANWKPEDVNTYLRSVITGKSENVDWKTQFDQGTERLFDLLSTDLNTVDETDFTRRVTEAILPPRKVGTLEVVPVPKPEETVASPAQQTTWKLQEELVDTRVVEMARQELANAEASGDIQTATQLRGLLNDYGKADRPNATLALRNEFGQSAWQSINDDPLVDPLVKSKYGTNPYLAIVNPDTGEVEANVIPEDTRGLIGGEETTQVSSTYTGPRGKGGLPAPTSKAEYDTLSVGEKYVTPTGVELTKQP